MTDFGLNSMPQNVRKFVYKGTILINIILFMCLVLHGLIFWKYDVHMLTYYNIFSFCLLVFSFVMLKIGKTKIYVYSAFGVVFLFMILAVICLGWEFGFQQYCIGFVASIIFTDFYINRKKKITKKTIGIVAFNVLLYITLRLWTYNQPYIYEIDNVWISRGFYILNSLLGFVFLIGYSLIYSNTVRRLENSLREMANIDPLTGICNRRKMHQILKNSLENKENTPYQAVVAMMDVDLFKRVNDTYGHDAGDEVLLMLAHLLYEKQENISGFYVSRWGGEEFLVFYEKYSMNKEAVMQEFDELRKQIQNTVVKVDNREIQITVTMGLAFYYEGENIQKLIKIADDNLYKGKKAGRNRVIA